MNKKIFDYVIIGGGISGVTFAHYTSNLKNNIILEKDSCLGGCIKTIAGDNNFFYELGAHTIYNSYSTIIDIISDLKINNEIIQHKRMPMMMWKDNKIDSLMRHIYYPGLINIPLSLIKKLKRDNITIKEYFSRLLGIKNYHNLIKPSMEAILCQEVDDLSAIYPMKIRRKNKLFPRAFNLRLGMIDFLEKIIKLNKINYKNNQEVVEIKKEEAIFITRTLDGSIYKSKNIALATDALTASKLLQHISIKLSQHLKLIPYTPTKSIGFYTNTNNTKIKKFSYIIGNGKQFRSIISGDVTKRCNNDDTPLEYRSFTIHYKNDSYKDFDTEELYSYLLVDKKNITLTSTDYILPALKLGHDKWMEKIDQLMESQNNITILGNYFQGLALEDCVKRSKSEALKQKINN